MKQNGRHETGGLPQRPCTMGGKCDIGCNVGAKNTLDRNSLAVAEAHGLAVGTLTDALHITREGEGYRVRLMEHGPRGGRFPGRERDVRARSVFVCAGSIGSTELLLRCRDQCGTLPGLPAGLGEGDSGNGDFISFAVRLPEAADPDYGPTITTASLVRTPARCRTDANTGSCWRTAATHARPRSGSPGWTRRACPGGSWGWGCH